MSDRKDEHGKLSTRMMSQRKEKHKQIERIINYQARLDVFWHLIGLMNSAIEHS